MYWYKPVHTRMYHHELHCNSFSYGIGFRGAIRDEPGLSERYVPAQESVLDEDLDRDVVPQAVPNDQYAVECVALADRNHNLPSETGL